MGISGRDKIILAVSAHPDDLDFGCSGAIAHWVKEGATAYYLILTDGSKGSEDLNITCQELTAIRHKEQEAAAEILGVKKVFFLDFVDGELENNAGVRREIVKIIRKIKPDMVITTDPTFVYDENYGSVNHPDHRVAGQATLDSVFPFARNSRTFPDLLEEGHEPHHVRDVLLINFTKSNFYVDITKTIDQKLEALAQHKSQHNDFETVKDWVLTKAEIVGKKTDSKYGESFVRISIRS